MSETVFESAQRGTLSEVFLAFLRLGVTSFGGPIAHIGYFRDDFVARRRWLRDREFAELLALCQFLPGPASSQLGFAIGVRRAGYLGGVMAWLAFTLPSAILMFAFALGAAVLLEGTAGPAALTGLKAVAVAVVAHAVWGMARTLTPDLRRILIAAAAASIALLVVGSLGQLAAILFGVLAGLWLCRDNAGGSACFGSSNGPRRYPEEHPGAPVNISPRAGVLSLAILATLLIGLPVLAAVTAAPLIGTADAFARAGAFVFGGGHVVLPLLQAEPAIASVITPEQFLAGYAAAQAVPGPLFTFAAYLGALEPMWVAASGVAPTFPAVLAAAISASVALVAVFLPGILLVIGALPFWNRLRRVPAAAAGLRGANAAVVGILLAALINPIITSSITGALPILIALGSLVMLALRIPAWLAVLAGATVGALAGLAGVPASWG